MLTGFDYVEIHVFINNGWDNCVPAEQEFHVSHFLSAPFPLFDYVTFLAWFLSNVSFSLLWKP